MTFINYGPVVTLGDESGPHRSDCNRIMHRGDLPLACNCDHGGFGGGLTTGSDLAQSQHLIPEQAIPDAPHPIDLIRHPPHYRQHPSGVECWTITRHMNFNLGNAIKYIWRAGKKGPAVEDLQKAIAYIEDEIVRLKEGH